MPRVKMSPWKTFGAQKNPLWRTDTAENVDEICDEMFSLACRGLNAIAPHEKDYLEPLAKLVAARTTLADLS